MEVQLTRPDTSAADVSVVCDNQLSHTFDLHTLFLSNDRQQGLLYPPRDPVVYGIALYTSLFPPGSLALHTLEEQPERILLVTVDEELDALPWEYVHGPDGFLVTQYPFVRGLPVERRIAAPVLDQGLHIVAVPSNPISDRLDPLDIEGEWTRLTSIIRKLRYAITLERTRPPTVEYMGELVAGQHQRVVHFMGHGGQTEKGAILCFEQEDGRLEMVTASELTQRLRGPTFLVTLNACKSATPGVTHFSNLAASLVRMKIPYALGMRFSIHDDDALTFSKVFYGNLARGTSVEGSLLQARLSLARSPHSWVIGVPVLYTSLDKPARGFTFKAGKPHSIEHQPRTDLFALPPVEGTFQGRIAELTALGKWLTADSRPRLMTIHGGGGQGKTALARMAAERFAFAWSDGVWAATLENLPTRETFVIELARFLGIEVAAQNALDPQKIERQVLAVLSQQHLLILLDNAETLVEAVDARDETALHLAGFLKRLPGRTVSLLVTSRRLLDWPDERSLELGGLSPQEGAALFRQNAPQRAGECDRDPVQVQQLSRKLQGHPLGLLLLGKTFNETTIALASIIADYESHLLHAEDKYKDVDHRHRTLYASLETSLRYLNDELRDLFRKLWIFHAPFQPEAAVAIFDPDDDEKTGQPSPILNQLYLLWKRGLLAREFVSDDDEGDEVPRFYRLLPTIRPFVERYLAQTDEREALLARFGSAYAVLMRTLFNELGRDEMVPLLVSLLREDLERAESCLTGIAQGYYLVRWGWVLHRLGESKRGLALTECALEIAQGQDTQLDLLAKNDMALVYSDTGKPTEALRLYEQALPITREVGDRAGEATTLNNMAGVYADTGKPEEALRLYGQALPLTREVGDRAGEATTLNNMAGVYADTGKPEEALRLYGQALPLMREVGDRAGEAATLNGLAYLYQSLQQYDEADTTFEQSIALERQVSHPAGEVAGLVGFARLLYQYLNRPDEAIAKLERAARILRETGLPQDAAGQTPDYVERLLSAMRNGVSLERQDGGPSTMPAQRIETIVANTVAVMTTMQERRAEWHTTIEQALQDARQRGDDWQIEVEFYTAVLAILDEQVPSLPDDHPYAQAIAAIQEGITTGGIAAAGDAGSADDAGDSQALMQAIRDFVNAENWDATQHVLEKQQDILYRPEVEAIFVQIIEEAKKAGNERAIQILEMHLAILRGCKEQGIALTFEQLQQAQDEQESENDENDEDDDTPFIELLIKGSIAALRGEPQEKMAFMHQLTAISSKIEDEELKALLTVIQTALFGGELAQLGGNLRDPYQQIWQTIVASV